MPQTQGRAISTAAFTATYEHYLTDFCGLAFNSCKMHLQVIRNLLAMRFPSGQMNWRKLRFGEERRCEAASPNDVVCFRQLFAVQFARNGSVRHPPKTNNGTHAFGLRISVDA